MEANDFIAKLKADGSENDRHDLKNVYDDYKSILSKLSSKDKGPFSLKVLCILCRNIDKVPSWRDKIDCKELLTLSIDCVRETRGLERPERVKTLACVYHIHKYLVRLQSQLPPELVLKLSYMPFECDIDNFLNEYSKTYWNLLADRLMYVEKLKTGRRAIIKLLPKLTEDIQKVIHLYDTIQFCSTILVFLMKKLHFLYNNEHAKELNVVFSKIFESLALKKDVKAFKKLTEKEILDVYVKFSDSFYVITENSMKLSFKDSCLSAAVRTCISFIGHAPELFHCLQTFYLNSFCSILTEDNNASFNETVLNSLMISCETTEKLGYLKAMRATYPYLNQLLRLYIEYNITKATFTEDMQESCLKLMIHLLDKLQDTEQLLKCDNCNVKSGLHDALRLSFLAKNFISSSLNSEIKITKILSLYHTVIEKQHEILNKLCLVGCTNHHKCLRKLQTDIHNTAILLNKAEYFESAIKLFDIYLTHEFLHFKTEQDLKNISRALYNKSICELDRKSFENALLDAFLSLVFAQPDGLSSEKYMSLVMDVKAKSLKSRGDDDDLQMVTVLDACSLTVERKMYGNLKPFFFNLKFGDLLNHEFTMYAKLWPSLVPIAGVWKAMYGLVYEKPPSWISAQLDTTAILFSTILHTPTYVRSIHNAHFSDIVSSVLDAIQGSRDVQSRVVEATLLFLKAEYCVAEASAKYEWKIKDQNMDPELVPTSRTIKQEYEAFLPALKAVELWTEILPHIDSVPSESLRAPLAVLRAWLQQLLHARRAHALQLAHVAMRVSKKIDDRVSYLESAGIILAHAYKPTATLRAILCLGAEWAGRALHDDPDTALTFICSAAIFYHNVNQLATWARLTRFAQAAILSSDAPLELATGRLLDAQARRGTLSARVAAQRHYLTIGNNKTSWCSRHRRSLYLKHRISEATLWVLELTKRLRLHRRSRAAAACALGAAGGAARLQLAAAATDAARCDAARATVDQRLKHIIGLPTNEYALQKPIDNQKESQALFTPEPKHLETMRDAQILKKTQTSPSIPIEYVPSYKLPEFYEHDKKCMCYACETPSCMILACQIIGLEASVYFKAKENDIAGNYFDGVINSFCNIEDKINVAVKKLKERHFEDYVVELIERMYKSDLLNVELEILIEAAFFELSQKNYGKADDYIYVRVHEIMQIVDVDDHMKNEIMNLMTASEVLRKTNKVADKLAMNDIENDLEQLKLSPAREILKTPESKPIKPPSFSKVVVSKEELPDLKCKIPVLNFDEPEEKDVVKKKIGFKIPVLITNKPVIEAITPKPTRSKVKMLVTEASEEGLDVDLTPQPDKSKSEFSTPIESTPDQFFTPMTSVKTYSKKTLRNNIVKNLEQEFSTQKTDADSKAKEVKGNKINKENVSKIEIPKRRVKVETGLLKSLKDNRFKRATSPGKLPKEEKTRSRRLPRPASYVDKTEKK